MATKTIRFFNGHKVPGLFHHTDDFSLSAGITTDSAWVVFRKSKTAGTELDGIVQFSKGFGQVPGKRWWLAENVQGEPCGCLSTNAWETAQLVY